MIDLISVLIAILCVLASGFVVYAMGHADSWEKGIIVFFRWLVEAVQWLAKQAVKFYRWLTKDDLAKFQRDPMLLLTNEEVTSLISKLAGHPYDTPSLDGCAIEDEVLRLEIGAVGLIKGYAELTPAQIEQIALRVISEFWRENRGFIPLFYISLATEFRLIILVPVSEHGRETLQRRAEEAEFAKRLPPRDSSGTVPPLTEEIDTHDLSKL